jgi:alpha,alpha-trehalose phosphorylase
VPFDKHARITQQCNGFTRLRPWDFEATPPDEYPLLLHHHNYILYSSRVVKQADLVFAIYLFPDRWNEEQKARDFAFYETVTVRGSSLSAAIQGVVAAEVGHLELAWDYLTETALIDLRDLAFNTRDGVHLASLSGVWHVIVAGFGGMRDHGDRLSFAPRLPPRLARLSFGLLYRGRRLRVSVGTEGATYELLAGDAVELTHHGQEITVTNQPLTLPVPPAPVYPTPQQPAGRSPGLHAVSSHPVSTSP